MWRTHASVQSTRRFNKLKCSRPLLRPYLNRHRLSDSIANLLIDINSHSGSNFKGDGDRIRDTAFEFASVLFTADEKAEDVTVKERHGFSALKDSMLNGSPTRRICIQAQRVCPNLFFWYVDPKLSSTIIFVLLIDRGEPGKGDRKTARLNPC